MSSDSVSGRNIRVASVQAAPVSYNLHETLKKVHKLAREAQEGGAQLVVFPEAFVSAYPRHLGFQIGSRSPEDRKWYKRYVQSSVLVPPPNFREASIESVLEKDDQYYAYRFLSQLTNSLAVHLSIGVIERSKEGATLWCTNLVFGPTGQLLSRHRKFQPTAAERVVWSQGQRYNDDGEDNHPVVETTLGKIGGLICWENFMPLARYSLFQRGLEIYLAPTADARPTWLPTMQHIAQEGRCLVISANQYHTSTDFPVDYPARMRVEGKQNPNDASNEASPEVWSRGGSCIVGPLGEVLAGPLWDEEGILYANFDLDDLIGAKLDFDVAGHYSRHDLMMSLLES